VLSWALASLAFSSFLGALPVHGVAYGSLVTAITLLPYLYFSAAVLHFGAELNAELRRNPHKGRRIREKATQRQRPHGL
jgi:membrane protein